MIYKGFKHSEKTKKLISKKLSVIAKQNNFGKWMIGKKHTEKTKMKMSKNSPKLMLGKYLSEETKTKIRIARAKQVFSIESLKKRSISMMGRKASLETRKKISEARKGMKFSKEHLKNMSLSRIGKYPSIESRKKMADSHRGEKGSNWQGGITTENHKIRDSLEIKLWREAVFKRDDWTCQKTGVKGDQIQAHHIQNFSNFPSLRFAIDNGMTLSKQSHKKFHKKYGIKNNTREQLLEFLNL